MAGQSDVKRRIKSVENTRQITRTMELVATSKLKKAIDRVRAVAPYSDALASIVGSLYAPELSEKFPLLRLPEKVERAAVLLLTADRGLAGGFNANLIKETRLLLERFAQESVETDFHIVGKKGIAYFRFRGQAIASTRIDIGDNPSMEDAESVIAGLREDFAVGRVDAVHIVSSEFISAMSTPPRVTDLLPIQEGSESRGLDNFILTPKAEILLERLLPAYLRNATYRALVENVAAEQGARRSAMKSATDNAGDVLDYLTRSYNRARQGQITQEIAEIVGGAAALE
ncbi:MAG: ATP synthase F1 subunit gamma [Gemmatimonadota bacterium]|jgi:F-type H+-transporting ATPase subunit gamma|uniref:ATP synthase gamma chain n=1 Tax=marine metagenome TaxID=408172 RepID=A0A381T1V9_9ZZZZ|nr:ATP synthase F1 subunit gamma [Gemmatimonadota bacterium]HAW90257.1 ATP synthase F1 subunit gamma [Gemmatimonadota bacterium]|tara:strand:+ start:1486 stop:2346 length:861 start_codon:yes stop_codon:yes gene_type:complete